MKYIPHHYRQQNIDQMMWGKRLFVITASNETPGGAEQPEVPLHKVALEGASDFVKWAVSKTTYFTSETVNAIAVMSLSIPSGILQGLQDSFKEEPGAGEAFSKLINQVGSFFRTEPDLASLLDTTMSVKDKASLQKLTDHREWINAFVDLQSSDFLVNEKPEAAKRKETVFGPRSLLLQLPLAERRDVYMKFVDKYIPPVVQEKMNKKALGEVGRISWYDKDPDKKMDALAKATGKEREVINDALKGILGMTDEQYLNSSVKADGLAIAKASLEQYYHTGNLNFWNADNSDLDVIPGSLAEDYKNALVYQKRRIPSIATNPQFVAKPLQYSQFKGALQLGVITPKMLNAMYPIVETEMKFERNGVIREVARDVGYLKGATNIMIENETKTLMDLWNTTPIAIKGLLGVGLAWAMMYQTGRRILGGSALALGAAYVIQRGLGEEHPERIWANLATAPLRALKKKNSSDVGQKITPGELQDITAVSTVGVSYAEKFDRANMKPMGVALALLSNVPMHWLMQGFDMGGKDQEQFSFDINKIDPVVRKSLEDEGWSSDKYKRFFANPENRKQVGELIGWTCYLNAAPNNKETVRSIEAVRRDLIPGASLSRLPSPWQHPDEANTPRHASTDPNFHKKMVDAEQDYVRLVSEGALAFNNDYQTFGAFACKTLNIEAPMPEKEQNDSSWTVDTLHTIGLLADAADLANARITSVMNEVVPVLREMPEALRNLPGYYWKVIEVNGKYVLSVVSQATKTAVIVLGDGVKIANEKVQQIIADVAPVLKEYPGEQIKVIAKSGEKVGYVFQWLNKKGEILGEAAYDEWRDIRKAGYEVHGIPEDKIDTFDAIKQSIHDHQYNGKNAGLRISVLGTKEVDIRQMIGTPNGISFPFVTIPVATFLSSTPSDLIEMWREKAIDEKKKSFEANTTPSLSVLRTSDPEIVKYDFKIYMNKARAQSSIYDFISSDDKKIESAWHKWDDDNAKPITDIDPLNR